MRLTLLIVLAAVSVWASHVGAQVPAPDAPSYKVLNKVAVGGAGGFDYVYADADGRKLYVPRGNRVEVYDLDTLKSVGTISPTNAVHGAVVDPKTQHGFASSNPVVMWDTQTLKILKTISVEGNPDGILLDPSTQRVLILSHRTPNVTALDTQEGKVVGTLDLGGAPEQGASDGQGKLYISLEDKSKVAVVDAKDLKVLKTYDLAPQGGAPAGLALDVKNGLLFVSGRQPATCVVLKAADGAVLATLPIGKGVDASAFNPGTMETLVSSGDGILTVIKEKDPQTFVVAQSVPTMAGARTSTLDTKTQRIYLIAFDPSLPPAGATSAPAPAPAPPPGGRGRGRVNGTFSIIVVGPETK